MACIRPLWTWTRCTQQTAWHIHAVLAAQHMPSVLFWAHMHACCADFKQVLGQRGSKGPAPPAQLTEHQTQIVKALLDAHHDDIEVLPQQLLCFWTAKPWTQHCVQLHCMSLHEQSQDVWSNSFAFACLSACWCCFHVSPRYEAISFQTSIPSSCHFPFCYSFLTWLLPHKQQHVCPSYGLAFANWLNSNQAHVNAACTA